VLPPEPTPTPNPADDALAERGRALVAAAVADTLAPLSLRERIEADRARARSGGTARRRGLARVLVPAGGVIAAAIVAIVLATGGGASTSVLATASLATKGAVLPAPKEDGANKALLQASNDGVPFPYWDDIGWEASGARIDTINGRDAKTVFYDNAKGVRAAYTILGGDAIDPPEDAHTHEVNGTTLHTTERGGRRIVTWERQGKTCVLSAPLAVPEGKLLELAAWNGKGNVPF
jgi:hypothetical protein